MPITNFTNLVRFSKKCGAEIPRWLTWRLESYAKYPTSIQKFGLEVVHNMCEKLLSNGAPGLHFYTLNQSTTLLKLLKMLNIKESPMEAK